MMQVANPIYDIVFKYLMEDERVARTILSALLKKNVVKVQTRRNEYSNQERDAISMFRIDFGATILEENGEEHLILIELQKTWLETETLRFRQYLGVQYSNAENMVSGKDQEFALPMVAVYLLGHKVGDIEEPVLYVRHHPYDYDDKLVTKGLPNPFVDSLTHDSIIVQIPRLHGRVNNRLDKVLSIFDQTHKDANDKHVLNIDESAYADDEDMQPILHRLVVAAADSQMRHKMNVEDEFFSAIERRDTDILIKDKKLAEQQVQLDEQKVRLDEQQVQLDEQKVQLDEQKVQLDEQKVQLDEQKVQLDEQQVQLDEQRSLLEQQDAIIRKSVQALLQSGLSPQQVAATLSTDIDTVKRLA